MQYLVHNQSRSNIHWKEISSPNFHEIVPNILTLKKFNLSFFNYGLDMDALPFGVMGIVSRSL